jgi:hypothetical protein
LAEPVQIEILQFLRLDMVGSPIIPATQESESEGLWFKAGLEKSVRPYLKNKLKVKGLEA